MSNVETLLEPSKELKIANKTLKIKKLSLKQLLLLTKWLADISQSEKINSESFKGSKSNADDLLKIISLIDDSKLAELIKIFTGEEDKEFIKYNIINDGCVSLEVITAICEINDFGRIFGNFTKAVELITKQQKSKTNS
jgi:hypothetical protein